MTEEVQTQETAAAQETPAQQPADLNISDLVALKSIIEVASQRGAFKATELEAVGKTFNKLNTFLESVAKKES
jgi:hypothetical protein